MDVQCGYEKCKQNTLQINSAIILGLTNKESELFKIVEQNIIGINNSKTKKFNDTIGRNA